MGVMECSRKDCENIMCDYYIETVGYICYECKDALEKSNPTSIRDVVSFMESSKDGSFSLADIVQKL